MICLMMVNIYLRNATDTPCCCKPIHCARLQQVERTGTNCACCRHSFVSIPMEGLTQETLEDLVTMVGCYVNSSRCYLRGHVMTRSRLELI